MRVLTVAAPKGGSGKTTTTTLLAVKAVQEGHRVAIVDLNADQGNLMQWHVLRGQPANPYLIADTSNITRDINVLRASGRFDFTIIDTPPGDLNVIENATALADVVIIPCRASVFDIGAIDPVVEMCRQYRRPFRFLLSAVDTRFKGLNATANSALVSEGTVLSTRISYRLAYINALTRGKTGPEIEKDLEPEAAALWTEVQSVVAKAPGRTIKVIADND